MNSAQAADKVRYQQEAARQFKIAKAAMDRVVEKENTIPTMENLVTIQIIVALGHGYAALAASI